MRVIHTPATHRDDPASSYEAEKFVNDSGVREKQQQMVYALVVKYPNRTSEELSDYGILDRPQIARRLKEVETAGLIERGSSRKSTKTGRSGVTWHPKVKGQMGLI